jgi:hypothetical protein
MSDDKDVIANLILLGALEVAGIDIDTGEPLYNLVQIFIMKCLHILVERRWHCGNMVL